MGLFNLQIPQGATYTLGLRWLKPDKTPKDLTGYVARLQLKEGYGSEFPALISLTESAGIALGGAAGTIDIVIHASQTSALPIGRYDLKYDLELEYTPTGYVRRLLHGDATILPEVST